MTEKSYVTMEQRVCIGCGEAFDTGTLLMDKRLRPTFERNTVTGWGECPKCLEKQAAGFVALIEVDPARSKVESKNLMPDSVGDGPDCSGSITPNNAHVTGRMMWIPRMAINEPYRPAASQLVIYVEPGILDHIASQNTESPHPTVQ